MITRIDIYLKESGLSKKTNDDHVLLLEVMITLRRVTRWKEMIGRIVEEPYWGTIMLLSLNKRKKTYHRFLCHLPKMKTWLQLNGMEWQTVWLISPLCKTGNILRKVYAFTSTYCKILIKKIIRMPTVVVRFETCKKAIG